MSLHNGCNIYHPHCYCGKFGLLSRLVRSTVFVSEQKLSSQVCGGCAFNIHFPSAEAKRLYVLDALTQFFSYLFWRNMCSGLLSILTFFFFAVFYWVFLEISHFGNLAFTGQNCTSHPPSCGLLCAF